jgi:hypothetical protein
MAGDLPQQIRRVTGLPDDLEAAVLQQPHQSLAQEHLILGDHNPDRIRIHREKR